MKPPYAAYCVLAVFVITLSYFFSASLFRVRLKKPESTTKTTQRSHQPLPPRQTPAYLSHLFSTSTNIIHRDDQSPESLIAAIENSITYLRRKPGQTLVTYGNIRIPPGKIIRMLADVKDALTKWGFKEDFSRWLNENFIFLQVRTTSVTVTGYYLPLIHGSLKRTPRYRYPLYKAPDDLVKVDLKKFDIYNDYSIPPSIKGRLTTDNSIIPYWTRREIDFEDSLKGKKEEIVWIDNLVDIHNLHVQGSGVIQFPDGTTQKYGYGGSNGHGFRGITTPLKKKSLLPDGVHTPLQINEYLKKHPELWEETFSVNPRYLFFRKLKGKAVGSLGVEVTAHRTIACDQKYFPSGGLALVETSVPCVDKDGKILRWEKIRRFVLNQDSGNAIKGKSHIDLFCGFGIENRAIAASMRQHGKLWFLMRKSFLH